MVYHELQLVELDVKSCGTLDRRCSGTTEYQDAGLSSSYSLITRGAELRAKRRICIRCFESGTHRNARNDVPVSILVGRAASLAQISPGTLYQRHHAITVPDADPKVNPAKTRGQLLYGR